MRPLDLLFEAMEKGAALAEAGRTRAARALERAEASPLAPLFERPAGRRLASAIRGERRRLDVVPEPLGLRDPFQAPPEATTVRPVGDPEVALLVYGRRTCLWTGRALRLAGDRDLEAAFVDLDEPGLAHLEASLVRATRHNTSPWVFARGVFVGGFGSLEQLDRLGQLELAVLPEPERAARAASLGVKLEPPAPREDPAPR